MSGVRGVLNRAGCFVEAAGSVDRVNGWEAGLCDGLGFVVVSWDLGKAGQEGMDWLVEWVKKKEVTLMQ